MAKRFTETGKWKNDWFKALCPHAKLCWIFLCDDCDHSGVWVADFEVMTIRTGVKVSEHKFREWFGDRAQRFEKSKYFIPSFFDFQYGHCASTFRAKQSALVSLQKYGLVDTQGRLTGLSVDCHIHIHSSSKSKSNTGSAEGDFVPDLDAIYKKYPRKIGKVLGLKKLAAQLKAPADEIEAHRQLDKFIAHHKEQETEEKFYPHFPTWVTSRFDWSDEDAGQVIGMVRKQTDEEIINEALGRTNAD